MFYAVLFLYLKIKNLKYKPIFYIYIYLYRERPECGCMSKDQGIEEYRCQAINDF